MAAGARTLAAGAVAALVFLGATAGRAAPARAADAPIANKVTLRLAIRGLGPDGCEVQIKPGHGGCEFEPIHRKVDAKGELVLTGMDVRSRSADRDCLFAITVKEPGQSPVTYKRGYQLLIPAAGSKAPPEPRFDCLLRSPSLAARETSNRKTK